VNVWLVFVESGQYSNYSRDCQGVFSTEALAEDFSKKVKGATERWGVLTPDKPPIEVMLHTWTDHITPEGKLSPDWKATNNGMLFRHFGQTRSRQKTWSHLVPPMMSRLGDWGSRRKQDLYVEVQGTDLEQVKAEHARLVALARSRLKSPDVGKGRRS